MIQRRHGQRWATKNLNGEFKIVLLFPAFLPELLSS